MHKNENSKIKNPIPKPPNFDKNKPAKKYLNSYLIEAGVNEEKLNKEVLKVVDTRYGKPYEEETTKECDNFIFKLIPGSKDEIKKIAESGIY